MNAQLDIWDAPAPVASAPARPTLRYYQRTAVERIRAALAAHRSTLLVMATGTGKTTVFGETARTWGGRVLVLAHRYELLDQARRRLAAMTGEPVELDQAAQVADRRARIVVGSVQTLVGDDRLARHRENPFGLVIIDEAHHAPAKSYRKILAAFPHARVLGVTATPDRGDGKALRAVFESVAHEYDIDAGIADGYLAPLEVQSAFIERIDLSKVKARAGDLSAEQLDEAMAEAVAPIARVSLDSAAERRTVIFAPGVKTARGVADALNEMRLNCARSIDGTMDPNERRFLMAGHKRGSFQFLVNCAILTEGYDDPAVSCVVIARPTKSRALYVQMAGRGLRVLPGRGDTLPEQDQADERRAIIAASAKPDALIVDIAGNAGKHQLVSPLDILGGYDDETRDRAKKKLSSGDKRKARDVLDEAKAEIAAELEAKRGARLAQVAARASVRYKLAKVDPFAAFGTRKSYQPLSGDPPTEGQMRYLAKLQKDWAARSNLSPEDAFVIPEGMTKRDAGKLIGSVKERMAADLCTQRQVAWLTQHGVAKAHRLTREQGRRLAAEFRARGEMPPRAEITRIIAETDTKGAKGE
jgi:superfamily II DNA or RNA helicase